MNLTQLAYCLFLLVSLSFQIQGSNPLTLSQEVPQDSGSSTSFSSLKKRCIQVIVDQLVKEDSRQELLRATIGKAPHLEVAIKDYLVHRHLISLCKKKNPELKPIAIDSYYLPEGDSQATYKLASICTIDSTKVAILGWHFLDADYRTSEIFADLWNFADLLENTKIENMRERVATKPLSRLIIPNNEAGSCPGMHIQQASINGRFLIYIEGGGGIWQLCRLCDEKIECELELSLPLYKFLYLDPTGTSLFSYRALHNTEPAVLRCIPISDLKGPLVTKEQFEVAALEFPLGDSFQKHTYTRGNRMRAFVLNNCHDRALTWSPDKKILLWNLPKDTVDEVHTKQVNRGGLGNTICFSLDGDFALFSCKDEKTSLYNVTTKEIVELEGSPQGLGESHITGINKCCITSDSKYLLLFSSRKPYILPLKAYFDSFSLEELLSLIRPAK